MLGLLGRLLSQSGFLIRNGFSKDLANLLLDDLRKHVQILQQHPQTQPPPEIQAKRQPFRH